MIALLVLAEVGALEADTIRSFNDTRHNTRFEVLIPRSLPTHLSPPPFLLPVEETKKIRLRAG